MKNSHCEGILVSQTHLVGIYVGHNMMKVKKKKKMKRDEHKENKNKYKHITILPQETRERWQIVFYIAAGIYFTGAIVYVLLARGTEQPWNNPQRGISFAHKDKSSHSQRQQVQYQRTQIVSDQLTS